MISTDFQRLFIIIAILLFPLNAIAQNQQPRITLWAWERKEDLSFLPPEEVGVAYLAKTIIIEGHSFSTKPRVQRLLVPRGVWLMAVVRVQVTSRKQPLPLQLATDVSEEIARLANLEGVSAIQIDFDARRSERAFYKALLTSVKDRLGDSYSLSITALASWCAHEDWLRELPINEAVPMFFRMGPERPLFLHSLNLGKLHPKCRQSIGIARDEPLLRFPEKKHTYVFNPKPWTESEVRNVLMEMKR